MWVEAVAGEMTLVSMPPENTPRYRCDFEDAGLESFPIPCRVGGHRYLGFALPVREGDEGDFLVEGHGPIVDTLTVTGVDEDGEILPLTQKQVDALRFRRSPEGQWSLYIDWEVLMRP